MAKTLSLLMVGLLGFTAVPAQAASAEVNAAVTDAQTSMARWRTAKTRAEGVLQEQRSLQQRIRVLKADTKRSGELKGLLAKSVTAQQTLQAAEARARQAKLTARQAVVQAARVTSREIKRLLPGIRTGSEDARRLAASTIQKHQAQQAQLKAALAELAGRSTAVPKSWDRFIVEVKPLDGPDELVEKADFVEDTRDRLKKKRAQLALALVERRQEDAVSRAELDFVADRSLFEEQGRVGRVSRQGGTRTEAANDVAGPQTVSGDQNQRNTQEPGTADPTTGFSNTPPQASPPTDNGLQAGGGQESVTNDDSKVVVPLAPAVDTKVLAGSVPTVGRDVRADLLINLRADQIANSDLDAATLERLVKELEALDKHLKRQAQQIRRRAQQLEAEEAK